MAVPVFVLDSFALLAYLQEEAGVAYVDGLLNDARHRRVKLSMHEVNVGEVYYWLFRRQGEETANYLYAQMRAYPVAFVDDLSSRLLLTAARLKAVYRISYADTFAVATAQLRRAKLVSGDPDLKPLVSDGIIQLAWPHHSRPPSP